MLHDVITDLRQGMSTSVRSAVVPQEGKSHQVHVVRKTFIGFKERCVGVVLGGQEIA